MPERLSHIWMRWRQIGSSRFGAALGAILIVAGYVLLGLVRVQPEGHPRLFPVPGALLFAAAFFLLLPGLLSAARSETRVRPLASLTVCACSLMFGAAGVWRIVQAAGAPWIIPLSNQIAFREWLLFVHADATVAIACLVLGVAIGRRFRHPQARRVAVFVSAALALLVVANCFFLLAAEFWIGTTADSSDYVWYNSCRVPGYYAFLRPLMNVAPHWTVALQLNVVLLAKIAVSASLFYLTGSLAAGLLALLTAAAFSSIVDHTFYIMTEALYAAGVGFVAAAAIAYIRSPRTWNALALGLAAALTASIKAVAPILIAPALILSLRPSPNRVRNMALALGLPIAVIVALSALGRVNNGAWAPTNFSGYVLAPYVAWGIESDGSSSDPELSRQLEARLRPILGEWPPLKWPPLSRLNAAMKEAHGHYANAIFGHEHIYTVARERLRPQLLAKYGPEAQWPLCPAEINRAIETLAKDAITRYPVKYSFYVALHFAEYWKAAFVGPGWRESAVSGRLGFLHLQMRNMPPEWEATWSQRRDIEAATQKYLAGNLLIDRIHGHALRLLSMLAIPLGFLSILAAALIVVMPRLSPPIAAIALLSCFLNTIFLVNALFAAVTPRYVHAAEIVLSALLALGLWIGARLLWGFVKGLAGRMATRPSPTR